MTPSERSDSFGQVELRVYLWENGAIWAEGISTEFLVKRGRNRIRLARTGGPRYAGELLELELALLPDPVAEQKRLEDENRKLRERLSLMDKGDSP